MKNFCFKAVMTLLLCLWGGSLAFAQQRVQGQVTDSNGETLVGVSVMVEGTTTGVATDLDGRYDITVPGSESVLVFAYIGMDTQKITVGSQTTINVTLQSDLMLDEVVMIGYGTQKKAVVSAAISTVGDEMLDKVAAVRVDDALKGLTPGVNVTANSGQPGAGSTIRIRGIGTINDANPLYVVDGMTINGGIDYLAPSDIERIDILKDAASCAVFGTRGANGVILVTTKKGSKDKVTVTYDYQYAMSNPWRKRDVLNGAEYALMMNEAAINDGNAPIYADPYSYGEGTDWQDALFNKNAPQQTHQLTISGTSGKNQYFVSAGYYSQEGIIGGDYDRSNYKRFTVRVNDRYSIFDNTEDRSWLNRMNLNINASYSRTFTSGVETNSEFGSPLGSAVSLSPLLNVYVDPADEQAVIDMYKYNDAAHATDDNGELLNPKWSDFNLIRDPRNGRLFTVPGSAYQEMVNPLADLTLPGGKNNYDRLVASAEVEFQIFNGLVLRSSINTDFSVGGSDGWTPNYYLSATRHQGYSSVWSSMNRGLVWQVDNTLTYTKSFNDKHNLTVMAGQSASSSTGKWLDASKMYMVEEDPDRGNLGFTNAVERDENSGSGELYVDYRIASLFARASYDYDNRYMIQATFRRDGSSRFGPGKRFSYFPSASVAWNVKNEPFMEGKANWLSNMKVRASWGLNGNDRLGDFRFAALTSAGNNYVFGSGALGNETLVNGVKTQVTPNSLLMWEKSDQTDIGVDLGFLNNAFQLTADYFYKKTVGMLIEMPVPSYLGETKPYGNVGTMSNSGVELDLSYRLTAGDFNLTLGGNFSYITTNLINAGNESGILDRGSMHQMGTVVRGENGMPFPYFYGYKTDGIFQNWDEVNAYTYTDASGNVKLIQPEAQPGDFRYKDLDGDGAITAEGDRQMLGKCVPPITYGLHASMDWKGIDFSMVWQGVYGNKIFDATRRTDIPSMNQPAYVLGRWTGEGTSCEIPRFTNVDPNQNWSKASDFFVKDASYFRLKNATLGYTLPVKWTNKIFVKKLRVYVAAENVFTFTKYDGFDPEVPSYIDKGIYPQARTVQFGANIVF